MQEGLDPSHGRLSTIALPPKMTIPSELPWAVGKDSWVPKGSSVACGKGLELTGGQA